MALLDFLKNKKEKDKAKEKKATPVSVIKKEEPISVNPRSENPRKSASSSKFSYSIIKEPHISEKATTLGEKNKYTFKVYNNANKPQIKNAVEGIYGVNVLSVNMIHIPHKKRRLGGTQGFKKAFNKAVVTIKEGQKIEVY